MRLLYSEAAIYSINLASNTGLMHKSLKSSREINKTVTMTQERQWLSECQCVLSCEEDVSHA